MEKLTEGYTRKLTFGVILLVRQVYGVTLNYHSVLIHYDSYLPFGLQGERVAMAPDGEIYFRKSLYRHDYARESPSLQHLFVHEMAHIWQRQHGLWVRARGLFSWAANYKYRLDKCRLRDYSLEQQASLIADHFFLKKFGEREFFRLADRNLIGIIDKNTLSAYQPVIRSAGLPL